MDNIKLGVDKNKSVGLAEFICPYCKTTHNFKTICDVMRVDVSLFFNEGGLMREDKCPSCGKEVTLLCNVLILCEKE